MIAITAARRSRLGFLAVLSVATLLVHGYHPFAEDGGIYATGVKLWLHPALYPRDAAFVTARRAYSLFDPIVGTMVRITHLPLEVFLLAAHIGCIFLTLYAAMRLAAVVFRKPRAATYAAILMASAFTLPVAGTSLFFMEPYLTARSFSTPLSLLAISCFLREGGLSRSTKSFVCGGALLLCAAALHLAMAAYTAAFVALLFTSRIAAWHRRWLVRAMMLAAALLACVAIQSHWPTETAAALAAAHTRSYWFLSQWQWYEWLGLVCPLVAFALVVRYSRSVIKPEGHALLQTSIFMGCIACLLSLIFARYGASSMAIARLQPLRVFHNLYGVLVVVLGGLLATWSNSLKPRMSWMALLPPAAVAGAMVFAQRESFPASRHIEWPSRETTNSYEQAFLWARLHTPAEALFALDSHYITHDREDAQNFRAIAERSMLSDYSKDGGVAAIRPALAGIWLGGSEATYGLDQLSETNRADRLQPLGVTWVVLQSSAPAAKSCPYDNGTVKVCPLK